jgi:hypothetical protein
MLLLLWTLTIIQPLAAGHEIANRLSRSRDAILACEFGQAWSSMRAVFSQLLLSSYVRFESLCQQGDTRTDRHSRRSSCCA